MAVAAPPESPLLTADGLQAQEAELRRQLPSAAPEVVALALQAMDNGSMLDPDVLAMLATPLDDPRLEGQRLRTLAKWHEWASGYADILSQLRALIEKLASLSALESHRGPLTGR